MPHGHTRVAKSDERARKVAVSLPADLLERVEQLRRQTGESRSAVFRRALELMLHRLDHFAAVREYVEAYELVPESGGEVEGAQPAPEELEGDVWE